MDVNEVISRLLETKAMKDSQLMDTSGYYSDEIQRSARMIGDLKKKLKQQTLDAYLVLLRLASTGSAWVSHILI